MSDDEQFTSVGPEPNRTTPFLVMGGILVAVVVVIALILVADRNDDTPDAANDSAPDASQPETVTSPGSPDTDPSEEAEDSPAADDSATTTVEPIELTISRGGQATERPKRFYARLAESLSSGDLEFALSRLDPAMDDLYGLDRCAATLENLVDPVFDIEFDRVVRTEPWLFESPVGTVDIDETTVTVITLTGNNQDGSANESHLTIVDGRYHWFTFC